MRFAFLSLHSTKRGSLFRPAEPSSTRTLRPNWCGQSSRNILLRPLSKASVTKVGYATALRACGGKAAFIYVFLRNGTKVGLPLRMANDAQDRARGYAWRTPPHSCRSYSAHKRKRPGIRGAPKIQPVRASGGDLGRLDLQKLTGACDRDRPSLHRLRNLALEVDV